MKPYPCAAGTHGVSIFAASKLQNKNIETSGPIVPRLADEAAVLLDGEWLLATQYGERCEEGTHKTATRRGSRCADHARAYVMCYYLATR